MSKKQTSKTGTRVTVEPSGVGNLEEVRAVKSVQDSVLIADTAPPMPAPTDNAVASVPVQEPAPEQTASKPTEDAQERGYKSRAIEAKFAVGLSRPSEIVKALKAEGITVTVGQIQAIRNRIQGKTGSGKVPVVTLPNAIQAIAGADFPGGLDALLAALDSYAAVDAIVKACGGLEAVRKAVAAIKVAGGTDRAAEMAKLFCG